MPDGTLRVGGACALRLRLLLIRRLSLWVNEGQPYIELVSQL
ncbi:hypothetical protein [Scytonema sp. PRP1]